MRQNRTSTGSSQERLKVNKPSALLSQDENDVVFDLLGRKCLTMATSVVQLFTTEPPYHSQWLKRYTGALCFVKDSAKRSYYCRLYCLMRNELVWEQEMYDNIKFQILQPYLIVFEGHDTLIALNFAVDDEADEFYKTVSTVILNRNRRREERKGRVKRNPPPRPTTAAPVPHIKNEEPVMLRNVPPPISNNIQQPAMNPPPPPQLQPIGLRFSQTKGKRGRGRLTPADIGMPTNFKHVTHVGWSPQSGFDLTGADVETLKPFLEKAGVSDQQLNDRETRAFIYDFIQNHNVLESVKSENHPCDQNDSKQLPAPPVPTRNQNGGGVGGGAHQRTAPPPPPRIQAHPPPLPTTPPNRGPPPSRPPPIVNNNNSSMSSSSSSASAGPPPPPPPPPMMVAPPALPPNAISSDNFIKSESQNNETDSRKALMDSIRKGSAGLKKVDPNAPLPPPLSSSGGGDSRNDLLSEIRKGVELRPVSEDITQNAANRMSTEAGTDVLADALRRALQERYKHTQSSDDESNNSSENEHEWDD